MKRITIIIVVLAGLVACNSSLTPERSVSGSLQVQIDRAHEGSIVKITDLTDFRWDGFFVFGPYTTSSLVDNALGFKWSGYNDFHLNESDTFSLLVFTLAQHVVRVEQHSRCHPDFAGSILAKRWTPKQAIFVLSKETSCPTLSVAAQQGAPADAKKRRG